MVTFFVHFLDHTVVASTSDGTPFNIPIESSDPVFVNFTNGLFPFTSNKRGEPIPQNSARLRTTVVERPLNLLPSAVDMASVFGLDSKLAQALKAVVDGLSAMSADGTLLQLNTDGLSNAPDNTATFLFVGDCRSNEHPV